MKFTERKSTRTIGADKDNGIKGKTYEWPFQCPTVEITDDAVKMLALLLGWEDGRTASAVNNGIFLDLNASVAHEKMTGLVAPAQGTVVKSLQRLALEAFGAKDAARGAELYAASQAAEGSKDEAGRMWAKYLKTA